MKRACLIFLSIVSVACAPAVIQPLTPAPDAPFAIEPIQIDQVDVLVMESFPVQVSAHITGVVGDGCSELHAVEQQRSGNVITITVTRRRRPADVCTMIAQLYDETLRLEGSFPAGDYTLKVNDVVKTFRID